MTITIYVYNENCTRAGHAVLQRDLENYENPEDGNDWHAEELTEENAAYHESPSPEGHWRGHYHAQIARTIREAMA